ncbi:MAG: 50S ribosomal protein L29 [Parcubacteria group bacterium]
MEIKELKQLSKEELKKKMEDARDKLRQMRFDLQAGKIKNVREIRQTKKEIARIMTFLKIKP